MNRTCTTLPSPGNDQAAKGFSYRMESQISLHDSMIHQRSDVCATKASATSGYSPDTNRTWLVGHHRAWGLPPWHGAENQLREEGWGISVVAAQPHAGHDQRRRQDRRGRHDEHERHPPQHCRGTGRTLPGIRPSPRRWTRRQKGSGLHHLRRLGHMEQRRTQISPLSATDYKAFWRVISGERR